MARAQTAGVILLAIRPQFAELILAGHKQAELRRVVPKIHADMTVLMYASFPEQAIVGSFRIESVISGSVTSVWSSVGRVSLLTRDAFRTYFRGTKRANALMVDSPRRFARAINLRHIRAGFPDFHPPQSFRYLQIPSDRFEYALGPSQASPQP